MVPYDKKHQNVNYRVFFHLIFTIQALAIKHYAKVNVSHTHTHTHTHTHSEKRIQFQNISV